MPIDHAMLAEAMRLAARRAYLERFLDEGTSAKDPLDLGMLAALAVAEPLIRADERERCAMVADRYAEQNRKASADSRRRANRLGNDPFGHGDMAYEASVEIDAAMREAQALAAAIRARPSAEEDGR